MSTHRRNLQLVVAVDRGVLTISIGINLLRHSLEYSPDLHLHNAESDSFSDPKIVDMDAFAEAICTELETEEEDGTTPVHRLLDKAALAAIESGGDGIELPDDRSSKPAPTEQEKR